MTSFTFQHPTALLLALLLIPLSWLLHRAREKRRVVTQALGTHYSTHRKLRDILRLTALTLAVLALAKPGYNPVTTSVSTTGRDIVFALDVSRSMLAEDVIPSRLEVAKQGIRDALETLDSERVGLVVYAGSASILCPLTYDHDFVAHMLDQAHPRSVDFGGTTMQSAVEKIVDQVFLTDRQDVQDIIILTDGGDHGSVMEKVAQLLDENKADTLIIGIGNPDLATTIPIITQEGKKEDLTIDGQPVLTRLDDATLTSFAKQSNRAQYTPVATAPFNLGQLYIDYAKDRIKTASDSENGFTLYQDASLYLLAPALILLILAECWGLKGLQIGHAAALCFICYQSPLNAAESFEQSEFNSAAALMQNKQYDEALEKFAEIYQQLNDRQADSKILAACTLNQGLCYYQLSQQNAEESATIALNYATRAQQAFLSAKRYDKSYTRAGQRIITTSTWIHSLEEKIKQQQQADEALEKEIQSLLQELQSILDAQTELKETVRISERKHRKNTSPEAAELAKTYSQSQQDLATRSTASKQLMIKINAMLFPEAPASPKDAPESLMTKPLEYIDQIITLQQTSSSALSHRAEWSTSHSPQANAITLIKEIIDLLSSSSDESSDDDSEDYEDDEEGDYEDSEDDGESSPTSEDMQGDLSSTSQMQALPEPNYSAEDILQEEQSNLQFRQEKRAEQNAAKVKKDY